MKLLSKLKCSPASRPQFSMLTTFAAAIFVGAALLMLPWAQKSGVPRLGFIDALFTATSATCVTGLTVRDTAMQFSTLGHVIIIALIQLGGIGIMTFATFFVVLVGRKLSANSESVLSSSIGGEENRSLRSLLRVTVSFTLIIEAIGATILASRFLDHGYSPQKAIFHGIFHSISAFCNAGFALYSDNLVHFRDDFVITGVIGTLIWLGGLGFLVIGNVSGIRFWDRNLKTRGRLSLQSSIAIGGSLLLTAIGAILYFGLEYNHSLSGMEIPSKINASIFHSVSARTAGYNIVDMSCLSTPTCFMTIALMYIGGGSGSTAGGVKITTFVVLLMTMQAFIRGRRKTTIRGRTIPETVVRESIAIAMLSLILISVLFAALLITEAPSPENGDSVKLLFETFSAFGTVGLSLNHTTELSSAGRCIIALTMYIGRLGPLAIALFVGRGPGRTSRIEYPEEDIVVG